MPRRSSAARVKANRCYTVEEAAETVGVTPPTVRSWIRRGLRALIGQRPALILGFDLKEWIAAQRKPKSRPMLIGYLRCLSCKDARTPAFGMVDYHSLSGTHGRLAGFCNECEAPCSRIVSAKDLPAWRAFCEVGGNIPPHA